MTTPPRGFALILVIWSLLLLTVTATSFSHAVRQGTRAAGDLVAETHAGAAIDAAVRYAALALTTDDTAARWQADALPRQWSWAAADVQIVVRSTAALVDLNLAPREVLVALIAQQAPQRDTATIDAEALADAILDWRDPDDRARPSGAESRAYRRAGHSDMPGNRPFNSIHELGRVLGADPELVEALAAHLTVHGGDKIHAPSASADVLAALPGVSTADAETFVAERTAAHEAGDAPDAGWLAPAARYFMLADDTGLFALEVTVRLPDGYTQRERHLIGLDPDAGLTTLTSERWPADRAEPEDAI